MKGQKERRERKIGCVCVCVLANLNLVPVNLDKFAVRISEQLWMYLVGAH